jgi:hypothetical protein
LLPYYTLEGLQAVVHIVVAILTLMFSVLTMLGRRELRDSKKGSPYTACARSSARAQHSKQNGHGILSESKGLPNGHKNGESKVVMNGRGLTAPDSINDLR